MSGSFEVDSLDDVVVPAGAFDAPPELELLVVVLMAESENAGLEEDDLFSGQGLPDPIHELQF